MREITVYRNMWNGSGCVAEVLQLDEADIVSETPTSIKFKCQGTDIYDEPCVVETEHPKTIQEFIAREQVWYETHSARLAEIHKHTLDMAGKLWEASGVK